MEYWRGMMNWPLEKGWTCQTCGTYAGLTWGFVHGICRCDRCHTEYSMRDEQKMVVDTPICRLKEQYKEPAKLGWERYQTPLTVWTEDEWVELGAPRFE